MIFPQIYVVWMSEWVKVSQSCPTLCDPIDYTVFVILQARILEWVAIPSSRGIFPTQELNPGLLSHQGSPCFKDTQNKNWW